MLIMEAQNQEMGMWLISVLEIKQQMRTNNKWQSRLLRIMLQLSMEKEASLDIPMLQETVEKHMDLFNLPKTQRRKSLMKADTWIKS